MRIFVLNLLCVLLPVVSPFQTPTTSSNPVYCASRLVTGTSSTKLFSRKTLTKERTECQHQIQQYEDSPEATPHHIDDRESENVPSLRFDPYALVASGAAAATAWTVASEKALAASTGAVLSSGIMNPQDFQPVCGASDGFYRFLQSATVSVVGKENFIEYGPLIAGGLLRIRLELCVIESFFNEAVGPFIAQNGLSWILPFHETVETFLAGVIFALASTFVLVGSSKILTVIALYADFLLGAPARFFGGFAFDRASGKPVTLDIGFGPFKTRVVGPPEEAMEEIDLSTASISELAVLILSGAVRTFGQGVGIIREILEGIDTFVGRYLVLVASSYILLKFAHFKVFPNFP